MARSPEGPDGPNQNFLTTDSQHPWSVDLAFRLYVRRLPKASSIAQISFSLLCIPQASQYDQRALRKSDIQQSLA